MNGALALGLGVGTFRRDRRTEANYRILTDEDIERAAVDAVAHAFGPAPEPSFVELFRYKRGLSIAGPGHYATMNSAHAEMPQGLYLAGDYFAHAGVEAAIFSGELAANRLTPRYRGIGSQSPPQADADRAASISA